MKRAWIILLLCVALLISPGCILWPQYRYDDLALHGKIARTADIAATPVEVAADLATAPVVVPVALLGGGNIAAILAILPGALIEVAVYNVTAAVTYPVHVVVEDLPDALAGDPKDPEKLTQQFLRKGEDTTREYYDHLIEVTGRQFAPIYETERHDGNKTPAIAGLGIKDPTMGDAERVCDEWRAWLEGGMPTGTPDELTFVLKWMSDNQIKDTAWWSKYPTGYKFEEETVAALVAALTYKDPWIRSQAAQKLVHVRNHDVSEPLRFALKDESASVRAATIRAIPLMVNDARAVKLLIVALDEPEDSLQYDVLKSFGHYGDAVLEPLLAALPELSPRARGLAYRALSRIDDPRAEEAVFDGLDDEDIEARRGAASALKVYADQVKAQERFLALLKDDDAKIRKTAVEGLGAAKGPDTVPALIEALGDSDDGVCWAAAVVFGNWKVEAATKPLIKLMNHENDNVAWQAALALRNIGEPATNALVKSWYEQPSRVKVFTLRTIFGDKINLLALAGLKDVAAEVRRAAANRLGRYSERTVPDPLIPLLKDNDPAVKSAAAKSLSNTLDPEAVEPLLSLLADPSPEVRKAAAESLGKIGDRRAIGPLKKLLKDKDEEESVKKNAALAIENIRHH